MTTYQPLPIPYSVYNPLMYQTYMLTYTEIPRLEWKNTPSLALPTVHHSSPLLTLSYSAPFAPIDMLSVEERSNLAFQRCIQGEPLTSSDYQAMNTAIAMAEFVLE